MLMALPPHASVGRTPAEPQISLLTCSPGTDIYELEGHTALRVNDGINDFCVNWGVFDFDAPNFVYRFVKGETDYMCALSSTQAFLRPYMIHGRTVTEQVLDLDSAQTAAVMDLIAVSLRPENRVYRYNYVLDNCATRPLALLDSAASGEIRLAAPDKAWTGDEPTFRGVMRYHHSRYPWYQFGIDLALGPGIDSVIAPRALSFAPTLLRQMVAGATIGARPLVRETDLLVAGHAAPLPQTPWWCTPLSVFSILFVITLLVCVRDFRRQRVTGWYQALIFTLFGLAGSLIAFLVFVSSHEATSPNWLLLWLNPFCLIVPACIWFRRCRSFLICYQIVNFAAVIAVIPVMLAMNQNVNLAFLPLVTTDLALSISYILICGCTTTRKTSSQTSCSD